MRCVPFGICLLVVFTYLSKSAFAQDKPANPAVPPPVRPLTAMTAELTGAVSLGGSSVPLRLTFQTDDDSPRRFDNYSFMFVLLDENGRQVGGPNAFIREAITVGVDLSGKMPTYEPRLEFYEDRKGLVIGRKYQLVCYMPTCDLACAVWFTLKAKPKS